MFNGHGTHESIHGHRNESLIKMNENEHILKNTIVYSIACGSALKLGKSCIKKGVRAFIGYIDDFYFWIDHTKTHTPLADEFAKPFFKASNQVVLSLINEQSVADAQKRSQQVFDEQIEFFKRSDAPPESQYILPLLYWDKSIQKVHGDKNAKAYF